MEVSDYEKAAPVPHPKSARTQHLPLVAVALFVTAQHQPLLLEGECLNVTASCSQTGCVSEPPAPAGPRGLGWGQGMRIPSRSPGGLMLRVWGPRLENFL